MLKNPNQVIFSWPNQVQFIIELTKIIFIRLTSNEDSSHFRFLRITFYISTSNY